MTAPAQGSPRVALWAVMTAILLSAMWGLNVVTIKIGLEAFPPIWSAFWRMLIAIPVLAWWVKHDGAKIMPEPGEWRPLLILGVLFSVQIMLLNSSLKYTSAAFSVVIVNSAPIFTNLVGHFAHADDKMSRERVIGLALAFGGVCVMFIGHPEARLAPVPLIGNTIAAVTAFLIGVRLVFTRRLVQKIEPTRTVFWQVVISLPLFLTVALIFEEPTSGPLTWRPLIALLYQAIGVAGIGFILWVRLLKAYPAGLISVFVFPTPLFGVLFSALLFSEHVSPVILFSGIAVTLGILVVTWKPRDDGKHGLGIDPLKRVA